MVVLDNLREGVLTPDVYDPSLNPLYRDVLKHYGAVAMPCRIQDPDRYWQGKGLPPGCRPFPRTPFSAAARFLRCAPDRFSLTKPNTSFTIEMPASLRSENCSPSARNAVRVPAGISVRLRRNQQAV